MTTAITSQVRDNGTHARQFFHIGPRPIAGYGTGATLTVKLRFDDDCKNGHDTFAITAEVRVPGRRDCEACGCLHTEIAEVFPELAPLIQWHLCSTDGPLHYVANTLHHAGDRDCWGLRKGEESTSPRQMKHFVRFGDSPIEHQVSNRLKAFIDATIAEDGEFVIDQVEHKKEPGGYNYSPKFQFAGMDCKWHDCPFDTCDEARQWLDAITSTEITWTSRTNVFGEGKARDLDAARRCAIWPEATDDQLCSDPHVLEGLLIDRLPALLAEFRAAMESLGFEYIAETATA